MKNEQTPEKQLNAPYLQVHSIWKTIQGEGPLCGMVSLFVRLSGCNLQCPLCDTEYTSRRVHYTHKDLIAEIMTRVEEDPSIQAIVFTGGEPFRQKGLYQFCWEMLALLRRRAFLQIETNGTMIEWGELPTLFSDFLLVVSPKTNTVPKWLERRDVLPEHFFFKYVLNHSAVSSTDGLPSSVLGMNQSPYRPPIHFPRSRIYIQPMDSKDITQNGLNTTAAMESCLRYGYRMGTQLHKHLGLP